MKNSKGASCLFAMLLGLVSMSSALAYSGQSQITVVPRGFRDDGNLSRMCEGRTREVQQGIQSNYRLANEISAYSRINSILLSPAQNYCQVVCTPYQRCEQRGSVQRCETYQDCQNQCQYIPASYRNQCEITLYSKSYRVGLISDSIDMSGNGSCEDRLNDLRRANQVVFSDESHDFGRCQASFVIAIDQ